MSPIEPRITLQLLFSLTICVVLAGCGGGGGSSKAAPDSTLIYTLEEAQQPATWTILVYLDADNNLEEAAVQNFNQMENVGSTRDVHIIVQIDRNTGQSPGNATWTDTRRYLITRDTDNRTMRSLRLDQPPLGELDMADPDTLRDFVQWGKSQFPADHYLLVVWDHGSGWEPRTFTKLPRYKTIASDETSGTEMDLTELAGALTGLKTDVLALDACYMQQLEVAYELQHCADYLVGSAAPEPSPGYNYLQVLRNVSATTTPVQMCRVIVEQYAAEYPNPQQSITQSAIDLSRIGAVATAASNLADLMIPRASTLSSSFAAAREQCLDYSSEDDYYSRDLLDYASRCAGAIGSPADAAQFALQSAVNSAVIYSTHNSDMPNACGLAVYVPAPAFYHSRYPEVSLAQDTQWDEWLRAQQE